jgi:hypothetical protein
MVGMQDKTLIKNNNFNDNFISIALYTRYSFKALLNAQMVIRTQKIIITLLQRELRPIVKKNEQQRKKMGCGLRSLQESFPFIFIHSSSVVL